MDNRSNADRPTTREVIDQRVADHPAAYTTQYLRRLVAEREFIRAALYNHGGSIITHGSSLDLEGQDMYTSQIGNDYHLDLVEVEGIMSKEMSQQQRDTLLEWSQGIDERTANELVRATSEPRSRVVHMRRKRAIERLTEKMQDGELGGRSGGTPTPVGDRERDDA